MKNWFPLGNSGMYTRKKIIGLGIATLVLAAAADMQATPLQSGLESPKSGDVSVNFGATSTGATVDTVVDFSTIGGLTGSAPLPPVVDDRLLRPLPSSDALGAPQRLGLLAKPPKALNPTIEIFRNIVSESSGSGPVPGLGLGPKTATDDRADTPRGRAANPDGEQQTTLKDLVRLLINRPENLTVNVPETVPMAVTGPTAVHDESILSAILSIAIDKEIVQAISSVLNPSIDINGVVAVNVFGLREIALLVSPGSSSIRLIDLGTGRSMSFRYKERVSTSMNQNRRQVPLPGTPQTKSARENLLPTVIASIRKWISTYVFNGITLGLVLSLSVFWTVWRFARSE